MCKTKPTPTPTHTHTPPSSTHSHIPNLLLTFIGWQCHHGTFFGNSANVFVSTTLKKISEKAMTQCNFGSIAWNSITRSREDAVSAVLPQNFYFKKKETEIFIIIMECYQHCVHRATNALSSLLPEICKVAYMMSE